jgi:hypothetical protein
MLDLIDRLNHLLSTLSSVNGDLLTAHELMLHHGTAAAKAHLDTANRSLTVAQQSLAELCGALPPIVGQPVSQ